MEIEKVVRTTNVYVIHIVEKRNSIYYNRPDAFLKKFLSDTCVQSNLLNTCAKNNSLFFRFEQDIIDSNNICVAMTYYVANKVVDIMDIHSGEITKSKSKTEGDQLRQHFVLNFFNKNENKCILAYEKISGGLPFSEIRSFLETSFTKYCEDNNKNEIKLSITQMASPNFLETLASMDRVTMLELTLDSEKAGLNPDQEFSENGLFDRKRTQVIFKPQIRGSLSKRALKALYKKFKNGEKVGLYRIKLEGSTPNGPKRLNSDFTSFSERIELILDSRGLIPTEAIFSKYKEFLNTVDESLCDFCIDLEE